MKNLAEPVQVYSVIIDSSAKRQAAARRKRPNWLFPAAGTAAATLVAAGIAAWFLLPRSPEAPPLPAGEFIAVLPFANLSDDPKQDYFADGITDNLITDLSRLSGLFVTSRQSTLVYKSTTIDPRTVGRELGVRNILEGSVQRASDMVRINAQLIDAATGGHKWAERYDGSMADIFGLQDRVTRAVVEALALQLNSGEQNGSGGATWRARSLKPTMRSCKAGNSTSARPRRVWPPRISVFRACRSARPGLRRALKPPWP